MSAETSAAHHSEDGLPEFSPNIATATAIASSKLFPAAVNELEKILNLLQNEHRRRSTGFFC
jgi:hypothetical protein